MNRSLTLFLAGITFAAAAHAGEKAITEKQMPPAVLTAFHKIYPQAHILGMARETEHGKTFYEIESKDGDTRRDLSYQADGSLAEIEETIQEAALPEPVKAALAAKHPGAAVKKAEKDTRGTVITYEVHLMVGKRMKEVVLDPSGKVLSEEASGND